MISNKKGVTIIETLVAIGIMAIVMVGFSSMILNQQKETKAVSEVLAGLDLQKNLISALADGSVCNHILNNPTQLTFNSNNLPRVLTPSLPIYASVVSGVPSAVVAQVGQPASVYSTSMVVKSVRLNITSGSGSTYTGNWIIDFDETKSVRPHKPITVSTILNVDSSIPGNTKITGCMGSGGGMQFYNVNIGIPFGTINLDAYLPAGYKAAFITSCGPNSRMDGIQVAYYSGFNQASCGAIMASPGTHTFTGASWFSITGYFR